jgi:diguanylate cyclase (GGDEF)-like protein
MARLLSMAGRPLAPASLERVVASLPAALLLVDGSGTVLGAAGALGQIGGRRSSQLVGSNLLEYVDEADRSVVVELLRVTAGSGEDEIVGPARVSYVDVDGPRRSTEAWAINRTRDPDVKGILVLLLPESAYDRFDEILMNVAAGAPLEQTFGTLVQVLRFPPARVEGFLLMPGGDDRTLSRVPELAEVPGPPTAGPWDEVWETALPHVHRRLAELPGPVREAAGRVGFESVTCYPVRRGVDGRASASLVVWSRVPEPPPLNVQLAIDRAVAIAALAISHASVQEGLKDAALRDPLTGLWNRRSFFEALESEVDAGHQPAVLYVDLDGFKAVNDSLGHLAGDAVLRVAARRLVSIMRPTDELARIGGDEFAILCSGKVTRNQVAAIAKRIVEQLNHPISVAEGQTVESGASVGIAVELPPRTPADAIIGHADRALHRAKALGRGRWSFAEPEQHP